MKHNRKVEIPPEFIADMKKFDPSTVKCYLILKELADITRDLGKCESNGDAKVHCAYSYIQEEAGVSKMSVRKALKNLVARGWISGFKRGNNGGSHVGAQKTSNEYLIPFVRKPSPDAYNDLLTWKSKK